MKAIEQLPYDLFTLFSRDNRTVHVRTLLMIDRLCSNVRGSVATDVLTDEIRRQAIFPDKDGKEISKELYKLKQYRLLRRFNTYNEQESMWQESIRLTSTGYKLTTFIKSLLCDDIEETKEFHIQDALINIRLIEQHNTDVHLYDALTSAYNSVTMLITHLAEYSSDFDDYIAEHAGSIDSAKEARQWIDRMMGSNYIKEYFALTSDILGCTARMNQIALMVGRIMESDEICGAIVESQYEKQTVISGSAGGPPARSVIMEDVMQRLRRLHEMAEYEYAEYMSDIRSMVTKVIERTYFVVNSFGADVGGSSLAAKLMTLIRYCEEKEIPIPEQIVGLYQDSYISDGSLMKKPMKREPVHFDPPEYLSAEQEVHDLTYRKEQARRYGSEHIPKGSSVWLDNLPCETEEDFYQIFRLTYYAGLEQEDNDFRIMEEKEDKTETTEKNGFVLPKLKIERSEE